MLEKIGLPAKPSLRGNNWVVDASHCQGCSSQFTFINRKHHCRRCGGLFCSSCTLQRMFLRGQGDSPVRICEPCKKLEEAARFELRHGNKKRNARGNTKAIAKPEDAIISQILGSDGNESSSSTSFSCLGERGVSSHDAESEALESMNSRTPDELQKQALEEKKKYKTLKAEGKSEEALRAFKRGKELERQAEAIVASVRKNRRKAVSYRSVSQLQSSEGTKDALKKAKSHHETGKTSDGFAAELRDLGWTDDDDKKTGALSLEGELASLIQDIPNKTHRDKGHGVDKTQVNLLKRKALALKRQGKLVEAKEELKQAKILEKQLEEQEILAGAENSDDEFMALVNAMEGDDDQGDIFLNYEQGNGSNFNNLLGNLDDLGVHGDSEVTEEDFKDPEIAAALKSFGWLEESDQSKGPPKLFLVDRDKMLSEIQLLKKEAIKKRREGSVSEAMALLKNAKVLERELEDPDSSADALAKPGYMTENSVNNMKALGSREGSKNRLTIQKELLALKKKALALRREGRIEEAEEELKKGMVLQAQLDELGTSAKGVAEPVASVNRNPNSTDEYRGLPTEVSDEENVAVTDQDMNDPSYLSLLSSLGWEDENHGQADVLSEPPTKAGFEPPKTSESQIGCASKSDVLLPRKSRSEIQRELLGLKREALLLRRQGRTEEAEEALDKAKTLEAQMADSDESKDEPNTRGNIWRRQLDPAIKGLSVEGYENSRENRHEPAHQSNEKDLRPAGEVVEPKAEDLELYDHTGLTVDSVGPSMTLQSKVELQRQLLALKRKALTLRRNGETEEAEKLLKPAAILEAQLAALEAPLKEPAALDPSTYRKMGNPNSSLKNEKHAELNNRTHRSSSSFLAENGKGASSDESLAPSVIEGPVTVVIPQLAKDERSGVSCEMGVSSNVAASKGGSSANSSQPVNMMDLLMGETQKIGYQRMGEIDLSIQGSQNNDSIKEEILAHKKKAVLLKREGKIAEAKEELSKAKLLERRLSDNPKLKCVRDEGISKLQGYATCWDDDSDSNIAQKALTTGLKESSSNPPGAPLLLKNEGSPSDSADKKPLSGRERFKLQQESLRHKRQALKLRREGQLQEAEAEYEMAKSLETQLEESSGHDSRPERVDDVAVEDILDPQLLSALKAIGLDDVDNVGQSTEKPAASKVSPNAERQALRKPDFKQGHGQSGSPDRERAQLVERIKAEKLKALNLKRSGKQAEAVDALRRAKLYEKKLNSLSS